MKMIITNICLLTWLSTAGLLGGFDESGVFRVCGGPASGGLKVCVKHAKPGWGAMVMLTIKFLWLFVMIPLNG